MVIEKFKSELLSLFDANIPIIHIETYDIESVDKTLSQLFSQFEIHEFHTGNRVIEFKTKKRIRYCQAVEFLEKLDSQDILKDSILLLKDFESNLESQKILFYLKSIAFKKLYKENFNLSTILVSKNLKTPDMLNELISSIQLPNPDLEELILIVEDFINSMKLSINSHEIRQLSKALLGLDRVEALKVLNRNYQIDGSLNLKTLPIKSEKSRELIDKSPPLKYIETTSSFESVGGVSKIKEYINVVSKIYSNYRDAIAFGVDIPKGVVIHGEEGSGKGLIVQASSHLMKFPIISFSFQKIESVQELKQVLNSVSSIGEAILWVNGLNENRFIFEEFISWMSCSRERVFTILTTEEWSENRRVWSFDEIFKIELPNEFERDEIFRIHLHKRGQLSRELDIFRLVENSYNLNGAEIEFAVKKGIEKAFIEGSRPLKTEDIILFVEKIKKEKG